MSTTEERTEPARAAYEKPTVTVLGPMTQLTGVTVDSRRSSQS